MGLDDTTQEGRMWALISYGSTFVGLPLGVVPLLLRNDAYAMHHAKAALGMQLGFMALYFGAFFVSVLLFFCTFGMGNLITVPALMLLVVWPFVTSLHGCILALNGDWTPAVGTFGWGDRMFHSITLQA